MTLIKEFCANYFNPLKEYNDSKAANKNTFSSGVVDFFKVASYFTLVIPLIFALGYAISSLENRISKGLPKFQKKETSHSVNKQSRLNLVPNEDKALARVLGNFKLNERQMSILKKVPDEKWEKYLELINSDNDISEDEINKLVSEFKMHFTHREDEFHELGAVMNQINSANHESIVKEMINEKSDLNDLD